MTSLTPRALLDRLVSFPTVSRDSNLGLIDWVEGHLASHGIAAHRHWNEDRQKAALFAHVGPWVEGGVVLSGHSDVVPVDGQPWTSDPWVVTERDGRLYGRGTCDMKGYLALALWALVEASRTRPASYSIEETQEPEWALRTRARSARIRRPNSWTCTAPTTPLPMRLMRVDWPICSAARPRARATMVSGITTTAPGLRLVTMSSNAGWIICSSLVFNAAIKPARARIRSTKWSPERSANKRLQKV